MREVKGLRGYGIKGLRKNLLTRGPQRTRSPDAGRGADAGREGRFDIMQKARMFVKVGWEERKQRFGIMHNVEMFRLAP